jgi:hypothetical protein
MSTITFTRLCLLPVGAADPAAVLAARTPLGQRTYGALSLRPGLGLGGPVSLPVAATAIPATRKPDQMVDTFSGQVSADCSLDPERIEDVIRCPSWVGTPSMKPGQ